LVQFFNQKTILFFLTPIAFLLLIGLFIQSNGMIAGGQDSYNHFLISKYCFKYPYLLLDQWGKPIYTILAHPFCFLGLSFAVFFNIFCLLLSGIFVALSLNKLNLKYGWLAFWLVVFTPVCLENAIATLTEPLNMCLLSAAWYAWFCDKKWVSVLLFSLLPWIRTEGFVIIIPILVYLIFSRNYKYIIGLFLGTFIINLVGYIQSGAVFWFITENPYFKVEVDKSRFSPEGGDFLYYIKNNKGIFGNIGLILGTIGALWFFVENSVKKLFTKDNLFVLFCISGVFVAYFVAHSFIIWKGMLGTHGMTRVMMVIVPCLAFFIAYLFDKIHTLKSKMGFPTFLIAVFILIFVTINSYKVNGFSLKFYDRNQQSIKPIASLKNIDIAYSYIKKNNLLNNVIYHQIPFFDVRYDRNPFAKPFSKEWNTALIWSIDLNKNWAPKNSIVLWDSYHAQREGKMSFDKIKQNKDYVLLAYFVNDSFKMSDFDIYLFKKIN